MTANFYKSSRQRLLENLNEGSMVFLYSGIAPVKSSDDNMHPYRIWYIDYRLALKLAGGWGVVLHV